MRALLLIFSFVCASTLLAQTNWEYDTTDQSHSILFPAEVTAATFELGDFMGVFYEENNELVCAGYSEYTGDNMVLTAFGASFSFNGFTDGQLFNFKHWSAFTNTEEVFHVNYMSTDFPNTSHFVNNGMSGIMSIVENPIIGCTNAYAINYNEYASVDDESCISVYENLYSLSLDSISDLHTLYTQELETLSDSTNTVVSDLESAIVVQEDSISNLHTLYALELETLIDSSSTVISDLESAIVVQGDSISNLHTLYTLEFDNLSDSTSTVISDLESVFIIQEDSILTLHTLYTQELETLSDSTNTVIFDLESAIILLDATIASQTELLLNLETQYNNDSLIVLNLLLVTLNEELSLKSDTIAILNEPIFINLTSGWNMIGYTESFSMNVEDGFLSVVDDVSIVKDNNGNVYWPIFGFNGIGDLIPGQGYQVNVNNQQTFSFPAL